MNSLIVRRTPAELIKELDEAVTDTCLLATLIVLTAPDNGIDYVSSSNPDKLDKLSRLMKQGGAPLGIIRLIPEGEHKMYTQGHILAEYENIPEGVEKVKEYFRKVVSDLSDYLIKEGVAKPANEA